MFFGFFVPGMNSVTGRLSQYPQCRQYLSSYQYLVRFILYSTRSFKVMALIDDPSDSDSCQQMVDSLDRTGTVYYNSVASSGIR